MGIFDRYPRTKNVRVPAHTVKAPGRADDKVTQAMIKAADDWVIDSVCFGKGRKLPTEGTTLQSPVGELKVTVPARGVYEVRKA